VRPFATTVTEAWAEVSAQLVEQGFRSGARSDATRGKAVIEVEGPGSTAIIEAWEHAQCLDTTVLYLPSGESVALSAGPCHSYAELQARLLALRTVLLKRAGEHSAA
jgi:hypothetical protein